MLRPWDLEPARSMTDVSEELKSWGHTGGEHGHIIMKSDTENAVVAVRKALANYHGGRAVPEGPAKGESKSNGRAEQAGKTVREFTRVLKEALDLATVQEEAATTLETISACLVLDTQ